MQILVMLFFPPVFPFKPAKFNALCARVIHINPNLYLPAWRFDLIHCEPAPQLLLQPDLGSSKQRMERGSFVGLAKVSLAQLHWKVFSSQLWSLFGGPIRCPDQCGLYFLYRKSASFLSWAECGYGRGRVALHPQLVVWLA